ncbi:MAG: cytochrome c [Myxococcales bacterium]|nr:cytochrome c [Myxococcales bacterium]
MRVGGTTCALALAGALLLAGCEKKKAEPTGRELFAATCARCHGEGGAGGLPVWDGGPSPRNFTEAGFLAGRTDGALRQTIRDGKGGAMPPFGTTFTDEQITALIAHLRTLDPGTPKK